MASTMSGSHSCSLPFGTFAGTTYLLKFLSKTVKNKGELAMLVFVFDFFGHLRLHQNLLGAHEDLGHENPYG